MLSNDELQMIYTEARAARPADQVDRATNELVVELLLAVTRAQRAATSDNRHRSLREVLRIVDALPEPPEPTPKTAPMGPSVDGYLRRRPHGRRTHTNRG